MRRYDLNFTRVGLLTIILCFIALMLYGMLVQAQSPGAGPTDAQVLDAAKVAIGMFGMGTGGYVVAAAVLNLMILLSKWGRTQSLFTRVPKQYRSWTPIVLGVGLGAVDSLATGAPLGEALLNGLGVGVVQQSAYEQIKGTAVGRALETLTSFVPRPSVTEG